MSDFLVIKRSLIRQALKDHSTTIDLVRTAYIDYCRDKSICPNSIFLRFPWGGKDRIIGLPAYIPRPERAGFKWISSFPENREKEMERASAVIILNDIETGRPIACLEGALISAYRTAAFAALAAHTLGSGRSMARLGVCGSSFIAANTLEHLVGTGFDFDEIHLYDINPQQMERFAETAKQLGIATVIIHDSTEAALEQSDVFIFATDAIEPHMNDVSVVAHNPLILHVSLRDLGSEVVAAAQNVSDNTEHAVREGTSMGNACAEFGSEQVEIHSLYDFLSDQGAVRPAIDKPIIFAPFGLGVLDIALAEHAYQHIRNTDDSVLAVSDFFS